MKGEVEERQRIFERSRREGEKFNTRFSTSVICSKDGRYIPYVHYAFAIIYVSRIVIRVTHNGETIVVERVPTAS